MTKRPDKPLLLVAASGLAREVVAMVRAHAICDVAGFLDDSPALAGATVDGARVLGPIDAVMAYPDAQILVCAGRGQVREKIVARLSGLGVPATQYATVVHPAVEIPESCEVGVGSIILGGVVLTQCRNVLRGDRLMVNMTSGVSRVESDGGKVQGLFNSNASGPGCGSSAGPAANLPILGKPK